MRLTSASASRRSASPSSAGKGRGGGATTIVTSPFGGPSAAYRSARPGRAPYLLEQLGQLARHRRAARAQHLGHVGQRRRQPLR
ncbi:MAG: hypothetical protein U1E38_05880 [Rhodospirillales bacterium]